jgi:hypothetical protein
MKNFKKLIKEAHLGNPLNEEDRATRVDKMLSGEYEDEDYKDSKRYDDVRADLEGEINEENEKWDKIARDEYGKPWMELSIAQKQEMLSYANREAEKQFQTDYEKRRKGDLDDEYDGMTDYQRGRMDEDMGEWPKELSSRYSDEYRFELEKVTPTYKDKPGRAKYRVIDIESGELKGTPVFGKPESLMAFADDLIKPQGGTQSTNLGEDINDPVLMRTRAAQMKRDAIEKKDLENKSKRISVDKAIDLRYELSILDREREDILMRIEDIGVEMDQTAEPEGGPIADKLGERLMAAERELRAIDSKIIDIKDDLGIFDMNESVNENTLGDLVKKYGKDLINFVIGIDELTKDEIKDVEYLDDRIQIHLEEPEIRQKYLPEGTCGYGEDGVIGDKPAGPNMEEDLEVDVSLYSGDSSMFSKPKEKVTVNIPGDFNDNEGEIAVEKELRKQNKSFKSFKVKDIKELPEDINLDEELFTPNEIGDEAVEKESNSSAYESLREFLRKNLRKRLS